MQGPAKLKITPTSTHSQTPAFMKRPTWHQLLKKYAGEGIPNVFCRCSEHSVTRYPMIWVTLAKGPRWQRLWAKESFLGAFINFQKFIENHKIKIQHIYQYTLCEKCLPMFIYHILRWHDVHCWRYSNICENHKKFIRNHKKRQFPNSIWNIL